MTARWMPIRITADGAGSTVDWCRTDGLAFDDPFVDQTLEAALRHPARLLFRRSTPLADLAAWAEQPAVPVAGLVLHLSRCGSTLVTRLLGDVDGVLALSEPGVVDTLLRTPAAALGIGEEDRPLLLRGLFAALGQARGAADRCCVVKLDAWAVLQLPVLRAALPGTPWAFLVRDAEAVLASHRAHRGYHLIPGTLDPALLGVAPEDVPADLDEYGALVTGRLAAAALDALDDPAGRVVDHAQLPGAVGQVVAPHFGLEVDGGVRARWAERSAVDAKNPVLPYQPPPVTTDPALSRAVERWAAEPVRRLQQVAGLGDAA